METNRLSILRFNYSYYFNSASIGTSQPATASLTSILALKTSYFAYLISFLVCANLLQCHHLIYSHVEKIDSKIIWLNIMLMFTFSLIPYLTIFVSNNQNSLIAQLLYGVDFIIINIILFLWQNHYLTSTKKMNT